LDIRVETDDFLAVQKTIIGPPTWTIDPRPNLRLMKRNLLVNGETSDGYLISQAVLRSDPREFRHLIIFKGVCVVRLDFAPSEDGSHMNALVCPIGFPTQKFRDPHFHDWDSNRQFANGKALPTSLPCASIPSDRIGDIDQAFWWFCHRTNVVASSSDVPGWPPMDQLL
jgi:hypothetical protein